MHRCSSPRATSATWWTRWSGGDSISRRQEGRTNRLYLTEEGRRLFEEVVPAHEDLVHQLMSDTSRRGASATPRAAARARPLPVAAASTLPTASCPVSSCASRMSNGAGDSGGR